MSSIPTHPKITPDQLARRAIVYVRQSSERQVRFNKESQGLQYALTARARQLGWPEVEVIDCDLGSSAAAGSAPRRGFDQLLASVARGEVGIVLSREVSRLSRTDRDWCSLLEVCKLFGTVLADAEQVYDLHSMDDQLVLGIKGTMSVAELNILKMRCVQGQEAKARRGALYRTLPPGYVLDLDGRPVRDPDARVQHAIGLVFTRYRDLWSVRQTMRWFHEHGVELPYNRREAGRSRIAWQLPTYGLIKDILQNPFYAGAYAYGRRTQRMVLDGGRVKKKQGSVLAAESCRVFLPGHHEGYIDWATYEEHRTRIRGSRLGAEGDATVTAVRAGHGLLAGLLRCGRCGRRMHVRYWGKSGTAARYVCRGDFSAGGSYCQGFGGATVDRRFAGEILAAISPLGVEASLEALTRFGTEEEGRRRAADRRLEQLEYEVTRAREQYDAVDPRNRLVAAELERRWESALADVASARAARDTIGAVRPGLPPEQREEILALGRSFSDVWNSDRCPMPLKRKIVQTVVEDVTVRLEDETGTLSFVIRWTGGTHTRFEMPKPPSGAGRKTDDGDLEIIRRMGVRYGDADIARVLSKLGRTTADGKRWSEERVAATRASHGIAGRRVTIVDGEILTLAQAAAHCGVSDTTIVRLVNSGRLAKEQVAPWAPWEIRRVDLDAAPIAGIIRHLRETGVLVLEGDTPGRQQGLFK